MGQQKPRIVDLRGGRSAPPVRPSEVRQYQPRRSPLKIRKQRTRAVITAAVAVCALLSVYALHLVSYMDRFTFQQVTVEGTSAENISAIQAYAEKQLQESSKGFLSGRNILIFKSGPLETEIAKSFPRFKSVRVYKKALLGNTLSIAVEERSPFALWCTSATQSTCYALDDQGVVFSSALAGTSSMQSPYVFRGELATTSSEMSNFPYGAIFSPGHFRGITALLQDLVSGGMHPVGAELDKESDFVINLVDGYYLKASYGQDSNQLSKNLALILSSEAIKTRYNDLEYIDLRFGNRVYYKFKNQPESQ